MDRIKDSGSFDWGSTPHGFTIKTTKCCLVVFCSVFGDFLASYFSKKILFGTRIVNIVYASQRTIFMHYELQKP